jgi:hypothetical protein
MQRGLEALDRFAKAFGAEAESSMSILPVKVVTDFISFQRSSLASWTVVSFENVAVVTAIGVAPRPRAPMFYAECGAKGI